jgi:peptidyl-prolyl cis-trans isomerase A (cyclophilin A)
MTFRASPLTAVSAFVTLALVVGSGPTLEGQQARGRAALMNPAELNEQAPATFRVNFDTSKGSFVVEVHRDWAPTGVDRFYNLVKRGFYDGNRFFRVLPDYLVQFGISGDPEVVKVWVNERIFEDDPVVQSNLRGYMTYIPGGAGRRVTQLFINLVDNPNLDASRSAPFGQVVSGMNVVDNLYAGYGENAPHGNGPTLNRMRSEGNAYLEKEFPDLDYIKMATIVP